MDMQKFKPVERLTRMRTMFADEQAILAEDYEHFTGVSPQGAANLQSKAVRRSEESNGPQDQAQS